MERKKICLACSAGGHLQEMLQLAPFYSKFDHFFLTFSRKDSDSLAKTEKVAFATRPARNPISTLACIKESFEIFHREKPDVVIATGADVSVPMCFIAKLYGKKVVFIESFCRPLKPGISGRLVYPIADLFIYQWKALAKYYPKGKFGGSIF
ncbi:MAG: polysaccharide biosynthesis protein [Candidatus Diapherotrites archaeon]|uniref:Polysaccharide biosynthesis protein n=1 Tax=Candidatus Iainarchaeum sp. TaxID=3101447 RepID=A0A8T4LEM3_9ARCH|nr:polysaccharide biosynthesis protein [Candidatus Diapherotrites archaeon]